VHIAFQVIGAGPIDLVMVPGWVSHLEMAWRQPLLAHFYTRLGSFSRLILFDKRGTGLSVTFPGADHVDFVGDADAVIDEIEEFLTGARRASEPDRVLATLLFTDIAGSTQMAAEIGDRRWRDLLAGHHEMVRDLLQTFNGREIDAAGDGFLAAFDGPARAIRCAQSIIASSSRQGIRVRAVVHTGECEILGDKLAGIAVHVASRCADTASGGEVVVTSTVRDLVAGSGLTFSDRGQRELKGVPGTFQLLLALPGRA